MTGLPAPPIEEPRRSTAKRPCKAAKSTSRVSKKTSGSQEQAVPFVDARHHRVWKACERCRMKKTKCNGESPCKRCKDDGLVCTAASRKKMEFKQLPRGYAEVLENTQYALIATVQKLYTLLRSGDTWKLGEPELNDRGQPVIHDIALRLGCVRPSPDLPYGFPEGEEDLEELQAQLEADAQAEQCTHDRSRGNHTSSLDPSSPRKRPARRDSSASEGSLFSRDLESSAYRKPNLKLKNPASPRRYSHSKHSRSQSLVNPSFEGAPAVILPPLTTQSTVSSDSSVHSPIFTSLDSQISPDAPSTAATPYSPWSASAGGDEFLTSVHALHLTGQFLQARQKHEYQSTSTKTTRTLEHDSHMLKAMQLGNVASELDLTDGTLRPGMLNRGSDLTATKFNTFDPMDSLLFEGEFEAGLSKA